MLDSPERWKHLDPRDMLGMIADMPSNLSEGNVLGRGVSVDASAYDSIVLVGLGGSAIGGDLIASMVFGSSGVPFSVVRSYSAPEFVGPESLVLAVSYSGNTEETLSMAADALGRGAQVVTVSSGGELRKVAQRESLPHCAVPGGLVPRAAIGYLFGAVSGVLERAGLIDLEGQLQEAVGVMDGISSHCGPGSATADNPAKKLAHGLHGTIPVILGYGLSAPVAKRWANQFNENAKMLAFCDEIPEMNHNGIVGWMGDGRSQGFSLVFLDHGPCDSRMLRRVEATKEMVGDRLRTFSSTAAGTSPLARLFSLIMMGDYTSAYSAFLQGVDPSTTEPIDALKAILSEKGR